MKEGANMQNNVTYRVTVSSRNAFLNFRGKRLRTPVTCNGVYEHELPVLKAQFIKDGLQYDITNESDVIETPVEPLVIEKRDDDVKVEELYVPEEDTSNSLMDKLIQEEQKASD